MTRLRKSARCKAFVLVLALALAAGGRPALSNDTDLLRTTSSNPFVFILVDTSASMSLSPSGQWVQANGDDPRSKLYQVKRVLYEVLKEVNDVHFGFAALNQDKAAAVAKHWLYYTVGTLPADWPIDYPARDTDGPVTFNADGTVTGDVEGDLMTFGPRFTTLPAGVTCATDGAGNTTCTAGTCAAPLKLSTEREKISRFPKLGADGSETSVIWLTGGAGNKTYRLTVTRPGSKPDTSPNPKLGQDSMNVKLLLDQITNCTTLAVVKSYSTNLDLELWTDFLMFDEDRGTATAPNDGTSSGVDSVAGFWNAQDIANVATCNAPHPFSGDGWEGNYDGSTSGSLPSGVTINNQDPFCKAAGTCYNVKRTTQFDSLGRPLDRGDVLPFDWRVENKEELLNRLAPSQADGAPDYRIASYYENKADATTGTLKLLNPDRSPLFASGPTPLGKAINDFRCFYLGEGGKCRDVAYNPGWEALDILYDRDTGCRRPYLIVISDGSDTCKGEDPCAETANFRKAGIRTWSIAYGADCDKVGNPLKCMTQNTDGTLLCPQNGADLRTELLKILGEIKAETRAFASAAVPSVQAIVADKVFLTNFTPFNATAAWDGHVNGFLKPVPTLANGAPDLSKSFWDSGKALLDQTNADALGGLADQRRVYYSQDSSTGLYADKRRLLETPPDTDTTAWQDLWKAFEIPFLAGDPSSESNAKATTRDVLTKTFAVKVHVETDAKTGAKTTFRYLLGDIFHSNPLVVGAPPNTLYFNSDLNGYRNFFRKHELRRRMLLVGANDGMLHAFDAGRYDRDVARANALTDRTQFNNGNGREVFAYAPREALPIIRTITTASFHQWGVDGTVTAGDVFIDPLHTGTPDPDQREWRTVVFGGMREGGSSYYALDITQPDELVTEKVPPVTDPTVLARLVPPPSDKSVPKSLLASSPSTVASNPGTNDYLPSCTRGDNGTSPPPSPPGGGSADCGPVPFPTALWEFTDSVRNASGQAVRLDEDNNGVSDLGFTWSIPNVGRIKVTESGKTVDKYVMIVGGGFDSSGKTAPKAPSRAYWIYMVDVETGKAIYKRPLEGIVPSEPAAVDTDQDGALDRIYVGTGSGKIYRIDLGPGSDGKYPALGTKTVRAMDGLNYTVPRVDETKWIPRAIFDASVGLPSGQVRPVYYRPSVIFVPKLGLYALSFGTGDREDLWATFNEPAGRFYVFVDDTDLLPSGTVLDETRLARVTVAGINATSDYLFGTTLGSRGWYLELATNERLITDPFALSGVSFFSTFTPDPPPDSGAKNALCSRGGNSFVYIVSTVNGNPYLDSGAGLVRNFKITGFVTNPYTESRQTKNAVNNPGGGTGGGGTTPPVEICDTPTQDRLKESLKSLFPVNCKFSNQTIDIKTISSDTRLFCIAPVPVCTLDKNWREH